MALLGADGLRRAAVASYNQTAALASLVTDIPGVKLAFQRPHFHEIVLQLPKPAAAVLEKMELQGVLGGYSLSEHYNQLGNAILVCATETKTDTDLQRYTDALRVALN